jgi:hypothetical protein
VQVQFRDHGAKLLLAQMAKLTVLSD